MSNTQKRKQTNKKKTDLFEKKLTADITKNGYIANLQLLSRIKLSLANT